ncbi:MAG: DUF1080 domain-containing protein [Sedimentisphaerales bacterium]|nr:DUF1080 domain-containing protein [Sedimentisphaerales bacterium]
MDTNGMVYSPRPGNPWTGKRRARVAMAVAVVLLLGGLLETGCRSSAPSEQDAAACQAEDEGTPRETAPTPAPEAAAAPEKEPAEAAASALDVGAEISLFDGKTLGQWKITDFGGQGDVYVKDGAIHMAMGSCTTGITWTGPVVRMNYEITLEAMRVEGNDFFCALTFPVADKPCTLVLGGWGGTVCGLSNIDFYDASENETTRIVGFDNGQWYHVKLRVVPNRIQAWLDGDELVDVDTTGRNIDIRPEVDLSQPLGVATWVTTGAVRNIRLKKLPAEVE